MSSFKKPVYIKELIKKYKLKSKKSLGQNFLLDSNLTDKIIRKTGDLSNYDILEIGPGPGSLTLSILRALPRNLVVVEKDPRCIPALHELTEFFPNKLTILNEDFLNLNPSTLVKPPSRVIANLPYNAGTEILVRFLESSTWPPFWKTLTLMFQKEVAERIIAQPGSKNYGRLSIISQWRSKAEILFSIDGFLPDNIDHFERVIIIIDINDELLNEKYKNYYLDINKNFEDIVFYKSDDNGKWIEKNFMR